MKRAKRTQAEQELRRAWFAEIGRKGGQKTAERHGEDHYRTIGKIGGRALLEANGPEYFSRIAKSARAPKEDK
jgi:hypothetical protein